jgi:hypothetical protein
VLEIEAILASWAARKRIEKQLPGAPGQRGRGSSGAARAGDPGDLGIEGTKGSRGPRDQGPGEEKQRPGLEARRSTSDLGRGRSATTRGSLLSAPPGRGIVEAWARGGVTGRGRLDLGRAILNLGRYRFKI